MSRKSASTGLLLLAGLVFLPQSGMGAVEVAGLVHLDGTAVGADELSDNAIFLVFSTWSPRCREIADRARAIEREWGGRARVFLVNFQEDAEAVEEFLEGRPSPVEVLLDSEASFSKKHKITYLPSLLAVRDGTVAFRGKLPADVRPVLQPIFE